jgi:hypothetical protein
LDLTKRSRSDQRKLTEGELMLSTVDLLLKTHHFTKTTFYSVKLKLQFTAVNCIGPIPLVSGPQLKLMRPILINLVTFKVELVDAQINRAEHPSTECDQIWVI